MAKITYYVKKKIGKEVHSFSVEGENFHDVVLEARKLSFNDIHRCDICGHEDLELSAHVTEKKGFEYVYIRCKKCRATLNFGQQKKDDSIFYLKTKEITDGQYAGQKAYDWKPYVPEQK
jgi:late competence protein required for DNA uptake (superfamily II DNA/RNA helicase)